MLIRIGGLPLLITLNYSIYKIMVNVFLSKCKKKFLKDVSQVQKYLICLSNISNTTNLLSI